MSFSKSQLDSQIDANILSGGKRTLANNLRTVLKNITDSYFNKIDNAGVFGLGEGITTGTGTAYLLTLVNNIVTAYTNLQEFTVTFHAANTSTTPTININGLGANTLTNATGTALEIGEIKAGQRCIISRVNGNFRIIGGSSSSGGGAVPTISLTFPSGNPTTNISLNQSFEFTFVSSTPILVGSTSGTALANGASANLNSLLTVRKAGNPITTYSASYNTTSKKITVDIVPTGFMDDNTAYEIVIDGAYNSSGACASLTYSFTTLTQRILFGNSQFNSSDQLLASSIIRGNSITGGSGSGIIDSIYAQSINCIINAANTNGKIDIFDKDDFNISLAGGIDANSSFNPSAIAWDNVNNLLYVRYGSVSGGQCYKITRTGSVITSTFLGNPSFNIQMTQGSMGVFSLGGTQYLVDVEVITGNISINVYSINGTTGALTLDSSKSKTNIDVIANIKGYYGIDVDTKANQLIFGNNFKRFNIDATLTAVSGYSNAISPFSLWKISYNEPNQLILMSEQTRIEAIKANVPTNTFINFDKFSAGTFRNYLDPTILNGTYGDVHKCHLIGTDFYIVCRYGTLKYTVSF